MIKISDIKVPDGADDEHIRKKAAHILGVRPDEIYDLSVIKRSKDARKRNNVLDVYTVSVRADNEEDLVSKAGKSSVSIFEELIYSCPEHGKRHAGHRPIVIGFGPAGIFTALLLAREGYRPLVYERGRSIEERTRDVERFFDTGCLVPDSNVQFGEGGAGTFSDGKLSTGVKDRIGRKSFILDTFVRHGADRAILTDSHPHIGTDRLSDIIPSIRREIETLGGEIRFGAKLTGMEADNGITGIYINGDEYIPAEGVFLCLGHSARDTFAMLYDTGLTMEAKAFAVGIRAEHKRKMIDAAMRQESASYKLTYHCRDGRGVYSFCMCPGGYVVNASSETGYLTVNGMSYAARDGENSNAAIVCTVTPEDYAGFGNDALAGVRFQRNLEKRAYEECGGMIPYQKYGDFRAGRVSCDLGAVQPACKGKYSWGNIRNVLPGYICDDIIEAMPSFGRRISGYDGEDTLFAGIEARTSSPVRILRGDDMQSLSLRGVYPVGEGAGYAGGIMSAAIDGMKSAEAYISAYA